MNKIICVTGLCGAGKSVVSDYFVKKGFGFVRFGQIVLDEVKKRKWKLNEANERSIREKLREKYGMGGIAILNLPKFDKLIKKGGVIADGLYSFAEYKILKEHFGRQLAVIAVYAPPELRYERLAKRTILLQDKDRRNRPLSKTEARSRDFSEIENLDKGGTIAMADYTIVNTKNMVFLEKQIEQIYEEIKKQN